VELRRCQVSVRNLQAIEEQPFHCERYLQVGKEEAKAKDY